MAAPLRFYAPHAAQMLLMTQQIRAHERLPADAQQALQSTQLHQLLCHAHKNSVFWRQRLEHAGFVPDGPHTDSGAVLRRLPILTRGDLQQHFEAARARWPGLADDDIAVSTTSGSTGLPVRVEKAASLYAPVYSAIAWIDALWHQRDARQKIAVLGIGTTDGRQASWGQMYEALGLWGETVSRNLAAHPMNTHLAWLVEQEPAYLKCSPHVAAELAQQALDQGVALPLQQIIAQSERVTPRQRALCLQAFGARIIDRYSCEEAGWIALQCPEHDHLHVLSATALVEIVDNQGQPCPTGIPGRVLLTSLHSFAMPLIRYELGDLAEWGPPCSCGITLPVIARLRGRTRQQVQLPSGHTVPMPFLGDELGMIEPIRGFRVRQYLGGELEIQVEAARPLTDAEAQCIHDVFRRSGLGALPLFIREVAHIDWPAGPKREEFIRTEIPWPPPGLG